MPEVVWTRRYLRELDTIHGRTRRLLSENPFTAVLDRSRGRGNSSFP